MNSNSAKISIQTEIQNRTFESSNVILKTTILDPNNFEVASISSIVSTKANDIVTETQNTIIDFPMIWDLDYPNLYVAKSEILVDNKLLDSYITNFGIRTIEYDSSFGLN